MVLAGEERPNREREAVLLLGMAKRRRKATTKVLSLFRILPAMEDCYDEQTPWERERLESPCAIHEFLRLSTTGEGYFFIYVYSLIEASLIRTPML